MVKYFKYLLRYRLYLFFYIVLNTVLWLITLVSPYITGRYVDHLISAKTIKPIYTFSIIILVIGIGNTLFSYLIQILIAKYEAKLSFDLNYDVLEHVKKLPLSFFKTTNATYLNQRINVDSNTVTSFILKDIIGLGFKLVSLLIGVIVLFRFNSTIATFLFVLVPIYLLLYLRFKSSLYNVEYSLKDSKDSFIGQINEQLLNIKQVKFHSIHDYLGNRTKNSFNKLFTDVLNYARTFSLFGCSDNIINSGFRLVLFFFGGKAVIEGELTIGQFTMINSYYNVIINGIRNILNFSAKYQSAKVSKERLDELLEMKVEQNGSIRLDRINTIELMDISFSYDNGTDIIRSFSYKFNIGKLYCIVGKNGTGKSTLLEILIGLIGEEYQGNVLYNDINIKQLDMYNIRKKLIGIVEQEPTLFEDTLINNLVFGNDQFEEKIIEKWMTNLFGKTVRKRFDLNKRMELHGKSSNVSGGENQKISIARVGIKNPDLIILDEPTSALDRLSAMRLTKILNSVKAQKIVIVVTHDKSLINIADEVIELEYIQ